MTDFTDDIELLDEFRAEAHELLEDTDVAFAALDANATDLDAVNSIFRAFHTIKGNSAFFGLNRIKKFAHSVEAVLDDIRNGSTSASRELIDCLLPAKDHLLDLIDHATDSDAIAEERDADHLKAIDACTDQNPVELLRRLHGLFADVQGQVDGSELAKQPDFLESIKQIDRVFAGIALELEDSAEPSGETTTADTSAGADAAAEDDSTETEAEAGTTDTAAKKQRRTMRVDEGKVDQFMDNVGELMNMVEIYGNILRNLEGQRAIAEISKDFKLANRNFHEIADTMQNDVMEIRQVPIRGVINKLTRIVRDLARNQGKEVTVDVQGEEQLIDKSYVEVLEGPLVHMIRNAVDHGIETPDDREAKGKPREGQIEIQYVIGKDNYEILLTDNGKGMDASALREKVLQKGLMPQAEVAALSDEDALQLIFLPGFSTAEVVTDVSGRGVGMDVVLTAVHGAGGTVRVESELGQGSTVRIQLPRSLTLVVVSGLLVDVGRTSYIIPMDNLRETIDLHEEMVTQLPGQGEVITVRDQPMSLVRLGNILKKPSNNEEKQAVVVAHKRHQAVLEVDKALGLQKVVVKQMEDGLLHSRFVRGGAILGDGTVGLVLDVSSLV